MSKIHISAIEVLEAVLMLKAGYCDLTDISSFYQAGEMPELSENEVVEEITDLFLPIFRSKESFQTALIALSASYQSNSVGFLADRYLEILKRCELCS